MDSRKSQIVAFIVVSHLLLMSCSDKWVIAESSTSAGSASLDAHYDVSASITNAGDVVYKGQVTSATGRSMPLEVAIGEGYVRELNLEPITGAPDSYHLVWNGIPQPEGAPQVVKFTERTVPGTNVIRVTGTIFDPTANEYLSFTVSHDPTPVHVVIGIVAGIVALMCGALVIVDAVIDRCGSEAAAQCGEGNVASILIKRTYGFSYSSAAGWGVGCGTDCIVTCQ